MILEISNILVSSDIITENFCCDLDKCKGICCVEGDAGAPVTLDEIGGIEAVLDTVWDDMSASAQAVVDKQGVAYTDRDGDLVTTISCALYPIREKKFRDGIVALNYNQWDVCRDAVRKGNELKLPVYKFLEGPLVRRFGQEWYDELCAVAEAFLASGAR